MSSESTFGQNDWLVDEMFQQYQENPDSVDPEWRKLFDAEGAPKAPKAQQASKAQQAPKAAKASAAPAAKQETAKTDPKVSSSTAAPSCGCMFCMEPAHVPWNSPVHWPKYFHVSESGPSGTAS